MLLVIDIGNTNTVVGIYQAGELIDHWRLATSEERTADEYVLALRGLCEMGGHNMQQFKRAIISSVVPGSVPQLRRALVERLRLVPLIVGPGVKTGMPILYENPKEVGADRIVNAVAAYHKHKSGLIVVDFGTATTFDCVTPKGEYLGGAICPGINISANALYRHAAKLPRVEVKAPAQVIGRTTVSSMQSGLYFGYVGLVDGLVRRMSAEAGFAVHVVATGGLALLIARDSQTIEETDEFLTLEGLRLISDLNQD